ncbi:hypothetical protein [Lentibacillus juripiscarius]|uniref:Uncharacterized protein n=1 Tax=Lentibacillus juripiscarius TaxID=257446 RepID=A0ABW5VAX7_9BACI
MTTKAVVICPQNISTYYMDENMSEERAQTIIQAENAKKDRIISLVAEKVGKDQYILIEKFEYFAALKKIEPYRRQPCLIYPGISDMERLIHIIKVSIPLEKGMSWWFKNKYVMRLIEVHNLTPSMISSATGLDLPIIKRYIPDSRIPKNIWDIGSQVGAKTVLEKIARSTVIPNEVKFLLYEHAIEEKDSAYKLTGPKFDLMKTFFSSCHLPDYFLADPARLKQLINQLIVTNFGLEKRMMKLLDSFLDDGWRSTLSRTLFLPKP